MKKSIIAIGLIGVVLVLAVLGYLYFPGGNEDFVRMGATPEERCNRLSDQERSCCLESLEDALERGWIVLGPDCYFTEDNKEICVDQDCGEGYEKVSAQCSGSLTFCFEGEDWRDVISPVSYSHVDE